MNLRLAFATAACAVLVSTSAQAAQVFRQTFANGLGAQEQVGGAFGVRDGRMGHINGYRNYDYSFYQLTLDLTDFTDAQLAFDYEIQSEYRYDAFNILASTDGTFDWRTDLVTPTTAGFYAPLGNSQAHIGPVGLSGWQAGAVTFDLSQFAGQTVDLKFQFQADYFANGAGVLLDNLVVTGTPLPGSGAVPEPATWAMMILGFYGAGSMVRRRRAALVRA